MDQLTKDVQKVFGSKPDYAMYTDFGNDAIDAIQKTRNRIDENNKKLEIMIQQNKKKQDIQKYDIDILIMGDDWIGKFDDLDCLVIYLNRTPEISSTKIKDGDGKKKKTINRKKNGMYTS